MLCAEDEEKTGVAIAVGARNGEGREPTLETGWLSQARHCLAFWVLITTLQRESYYGVQLGELLKLKGDDPCPALCAKSNWGNVRITLLRLLEEEQGHSCVSMEASARGR